MTKKEALQSIEKRHWYIQSTVGHFSTNYPWVIGFMRVGNYFDVGYEDVWLGIKNAMLWEYSDEDQLGKIIGNVYCNQEKTKRVIKNWHPFKNEFFKWCEEIPDKIKKWNDSELSLYFMEFLEKFIEVWAAPLVADAIGVYTERVLLPEFEKVLPESARANSHEFFARVSQPASYSFVIKEHLSLFKLALLYINRAENFGKELARHQMEYYWIENTYKDIKELPKEYFKEKVATEAGKGKDFIVKEIERLELLPKKIEKEKAEVFKSFDFPPVLLESLKLTPLLGEWLDDRKEMNLRGNHYLMLFLKEIGERKSLSLIDMYYLLPKEAVGLLKGESFSEEELVRRKEATVLIAEHNGRETLFSGKDALEIILAFDKKNESGENVEVKGIVASKGPSFSYRGKIRVVLDPSAAKFFDGEILVTSNTRPEFVPIMKKALAVITDEGGITAHAAIVSRELGKPCIIGTKIATKVLKDGDMVEVDIIKGLVRIIK